MDPFTTHTGRVATLDRANVDTDQIIPKQFLKSIRRTGFGPALFFDWRYLPDGSPDPAFELNQPRFAGATILAVRNNFGCGSSREHAVWALQQYGFRVIIAPWIERDGQRMPAFAEIFRGNAARNGLLLAEMEASAVEAVFEAARGEAGATATVDLRNRTVTLHGLAARVLPFEIDDETRQALLDGVDEVRRTLMFEEDIRAFEQRHDPQMPLSPA